MIESIKTLIPPIKIVKYRWT